MQKEHSVSSEMPKPSDEAPDSTLAGRMVITARDYGDGILIPEVEFDPPGRINQGWFDRHHHFFLRHIQRALVAERTGIARRLYNENGATS